MSLEQCVGVTAGMNSWAGFEKNITTDIDITKQNRITPYKVIIKTT